MISTAVQNRFGFAQDQLYQWERSLGSVGGKLAAFPVVVGDTILESLKPLCQAVESAAFAVFSIFAVLVYLPQFKGEMATRAMRMTILNLNDTIKNLAYTVLKAILAPLFALAQMTLTLIDSKHATKTEDHFKMTKGDLEKSTKREEKQMYQSVQRYIRDHHFGNNGKPTLVGRCIMLPLSVGDVLFQIYTRVITTFAILDAAIQLLGAIGHQSKDLLKQSFRNIDRTANAIAELVAVVVMLPITLIAQTIAIAWDPNGVRAISFELYKPHINDLRLSGFNGIEKKIQNLGEAKKWIPLAEANAKSA